MSTLTSHLISSYQSAQQPRRGPFGQPLPEPASLVQTAKGYYDPTMHGNFGMGYGTPNTSMANTTLLPMPTQEVCEATAIQIADLQAKLDKRLGPEYISSRTGAGGMKLNYIEGWKAINLANEVFGFNGWSSSITSMSVDFLDYNEQSQRYNVGVTAIIKVTLRDGTFHEDVGYGVLENAKQKGPALDKCKKEAVTDGVKRALRSFGNVLGNCLYDKHYTAEVTKIKVPVVKVDRSSLHRRPEFAEPSAAGPSRPPPNMANNTTVGVDRKPIIPELAQPVSKPASAIPAHIKPENSKSAPNPSSSSSSRPPVNGLQTPRETPNNSIISDKPPILPPSAKSISAALEKSILPANLDKGKQREDTAGNCGVSLTQASNYFGDDDDDALYAQMEIADEEYSYIPADSVVVVDDTYNAADEELVLAGLDVPPSPPTTSKRIENPKATVSHHPPQSANSKSQEASPNSKARMREAVKQALMEQGTSKADRHPSSTTASSSSDSEAPSKNPTKSNTSLNARPWNRVSSNPSRPMTSSKGNQT
ncbi:DNA repair protein rad52 [Tulasnella sp. 418]|nr:DNA repair protein rad52 [Tulasnella sp. 418]